jgi:hypothetical protein
MTVDSRYTTWNKPFKERKKLNKKKCPHFFGHCHACPWFVKLDVIISKYFTFEDVKPWYNSTCNIQYTM